MARRSANDEAVRLFASERRVFSKAELAAAVGRAAAEAVNRLVDAGEIDRHAIGVYAIRGIPATDQRVADKIAQTGARSLGGDASERRARRTEERTAAALARRAAATDEPVTDRIMRRFEEHPVASASDVRRDVGKGAPGALASLASQGKLQRINAGLYARPDVDFLGPEMTAYVERHSVEQAAVKREIEEARAILGRLPDGADAVTYGVFRVPGRQTRVYVNIAGMPTIYAVRKRKRPDVSIGWHGGKDAGISPRTAEHIARLVFDELPDDIDAFIQLVDDHRAPTSTRRRSGGYRAGPHEQCEHEAGYEAPPSGYGYGPGDTAKLDPSRLSSPLSEPIRLEIDDREDDYILTRLTGVENLHVIRTRLQIGDFRATHRGRTIVFERKTTDDLIASMTDGRLTHQVRAMSESGITSCFIVEGGLFASRGQPLPRLAAMQTRLEFGMNMRILETIDMTHTAYAIVVAVRDFFLGCDGKFDLAPVRLPGIGPIEIAKVMLETIPSISPTRSAALIRRFGSIAGVAAASVKEISEIDGIGATTARRLHEVLHAGQALHA